MLIDTSNNGIVAVLALFVVSAANAAPAVSICSNSFAVCAVPPILDAHSSFVRETSQITKSHNSHLTGITAEFLKPPVGVTDTTALPGGAKSLPAVPGALLMVLTGFLCVSLVKDRRLWLAGLAGLLWAGQSGIQALPQLATHLSSKKHIQRKPLVSTVCLHQLENFGRLRSDIEGTQYIGLLHHLAGIPHNCFRSGYSPTSERKLRVPQFAIRSFSFYLIQATNCLVSGAEQLVYFSQAPIFAQLPRGPPNLA